jgi:hypothetical protein
MLPVFGLANDYASLRKPGRDDRDLFQLHLGGIIAASMGAAAAANVSSSIHTVDGADVCRVHVHPSGPPSRGSTAAEALRGLLARSPRGVPSPVHHR